MRTAGATARQAGKAHPAAGPETELPDRVGRVFRAARQMPAAPADEGGKAITIERDQADRQQLERQIDRRPEAADHRSDDAAGFEGILAHGRVSSLSRASTTASNTRRVEVWRGR